MAIRNLSALSDYNMRDLNGPLVLRHEGEPNISIVAFGAPGKPADLGQFPEKPDAADRLDKRKTLSCIDPKEGSFYDGVQITPSYMEFKDPSEGMLLQQSMTIRNMGKNSALVRIRQPNSQALKIKALNGSLLLSPGLALTRRVTYSFKRPAMLHTIIPIEINEHKIDYHIVCSLSTEWIKIEPDSVDFGTVDIGCLSEMKNITITNIGGKSTRFTIDLGNNTMGINVKPRTGIVRPRSFVQLQITMTGLAEGTFCNEFWIKSSPDIRVPIKVSVLVPRLVIQYPDRSDNFALIDFPMTYAKDRRVDKLVLKNVSSQFSTFVVLGEIGNQLVPIEDIDRNVHPTVDVFKIRPVEGHLGPFGEIIIQIEFSPTVNAMEKLRMQKTRENEAFMLFLRIVKVHGREVRKLIEDQKSNSSETHENSVTSGYETMDGNVKLCLHGEAETPNLQFLPDELHFDHFESGGTEERAIRIENSSKNNSIGFSFVANGSANCEPKEGNIGPRKSCEVLVKIGRSKIPYIEPKIRLAFDAIVKTRDQVKSGRSSNIKIATFYVNCYVNCSHMKSIKPTTKMCTGESRKTSSEQFSRSAMIQKVNEAKYWANYLRTISDFKERKNMARDLSNLAENYCQDLEKMLENNCEIIPEMAKFIVHRKFDQFDPHIVEKRNEKASTPLSPLEIYKVKISPRTCAFGSVVMKSAENQELLIENKNNFPVTIKLLSSSTKNIRFPTGSEFNLRPESFAKIFVQFCADQIGEFNDHIEYIINNSHTFELTVKANVTYKLLTLCTRELVLGTWEGFLLEESYRPLLGYVEVENELNARTNFKWDLPASSNYKIAPQIGSVRGRRNLLLSVNHETMLEKLPKNENTSRVKSTHLTMNVEGGARETLKLDTKWPARPEVHFFNDSLDVGEIPLNMTHLARALIQNAECNPMAFEIDDRSFGYGMKIHPMRGIVPPRGIAIIEMFLKFEICLEFTINIRAIIQKYHTIEMRLTGRVSFPMLKFEPTKVEMGRMSAGASQICPLSVTNLGKTIVELSFRLQYYPEFCVNFLSHVEQPTECEQAKLIIPPESSKTFFLRFDPVDTAKVLFYLPIVINDILGPVVMSNAKSSDPQEYFTPYNHLYTISDDMRIIKSPGSLPTIVVDASVTSSVLSFNKLFFSFATGEQLEDTLKITNNARKNTSFVIRIDQVTEKNSGFTITWERGDKVEFIDGISILCTLESGKGTQLRIKFDPEGREGDFLANAPIFVKGELDGSVYNELKLRGKNIRDRLESGIREIFFHPVPLKVHIFFNTFRKIPFQKNSLESNSRVVAAVLGLGHTNIEMEEILEISAPKISKNCHLTVDILEPDKLFGHFSKDLITITFPRGNHFTFGPGKRTESVEIRVKFYSDKPISFRTKLLIKDEENLVTGLTIIVFATADNCLLTTHAYPLLSGNNFGEFEYQQAMCPSIESEISENWSTERQDSTRNRRRLTEGISKHSKHSNFSHPDNAEKCTNGLNIRMAKDSIDEIGEDYLELEINSVLRSSVISAVEPPFSKSRKNSRNDYCYFSINSHHSAYEQHLQRTIKASEEWLYSGPLGYQFYPQIIDGINGAFSNLEKTKKINSDNKKRFNVDLQSFIDTLRTIVGPEIDSFIGTPSSLPEDDVERIMIVLQLYDNMLNFLVVQGAHLCHVSACYLLSYTDYSISIDENIFLESTKNCVEKNVDISNPMPSNLFEARSRQCWLDVVLQTFKCFVLKRITLEGVESSISSVIENFVEFSEPELEKNSSKSAIEKALKKIQKNSKKIEKYCEEESLLLAWLQHHYEAQRQQNWLNNRENLENSLEGKEEPRERIIQNFQADLADGVVFLALTGSYCPFLIEESFNNIYVCPKRPEEALHNAICVVRAWQKIRLGFMVTPQELVRPNSVQTLMLVVHLFETLPTYLPWKKVNFNCGLGEKVSQTLTLSNPESSRASYVLQLFGNSLQFFTAQTNRIFTLNPRGNGRIKIEFHARKIQKIQAFLLLCGGAVGPKFVKNQCFLLEGEICNFGIIEEYKIRTPLYKTVDKTLTIKVPYEYGTKYEIWMADDSPIDPATIKMTRWSDLRLRKIRKRLFLNQQSLDVEKNAFAADLSIKIACITSLPKHVWIMFQDKVGDFIVHINLDPQSAISDRISMSWKRGCCICDNPTKKIDENCPHNISIPIPARNNHLWTCLGQMFRESLASKERDFWKSILDTNIGQKIIPCFLDHLEDSEDRELLSHFRNSRVVYNVTTSGKINRLVLPEKFTIPDVMAISDSTPLKIHIDESTPRELGFTMILGSLDKLENRIYRINLLCEN